MHHTPDQSFPICPQLVDFVDVELTDRKTRQELYSGPYRGEKTLWFQA